MSRPKASQWRALSSQELILKKTGLEKDCLDLRQKKVTGQLDKPHFFKWYRKQIAQINTVMKEKTHA